MEFFTYILRSTKSGKYYVGQSENLKTRVVDHNKGKVKSTKSERPWELVYFESYNTRSKAYNREQEIKKMKSRKYIETLINKRE